METTDPVAKLEETITLLRKNAELLRRGSQGELAPAFTAGTNNVDETLAWAQKNDDAAATLQGVVDSFRSRE